MTDITETAAQRSIELLAEALHPEGFVASPADEHYAAIWARDAAMACLGASHSGESTLIDGVETTLRTLASLATPLGQVPNAYWPERGYWDWGEGGTTDATAWLVIALAEHVAATGREAIAAELWPSIESALSWLRHQDVTGTGLVDSPAGGDWMDSTLRRAGRVFSVNVLYHWAAVGASELAARLDRQVPLDTDQIAAQIDALFWPEPGDDLAELNLADYPEGAVVHFPHPLADSAFARVARTDRNHHLALVAYGRFVDRCDVLAEALAIASGLNTARAGVVLDAISGCAEPYPSRNWPEPFLPDESGTLFDAAADALQDPRWRNPAGSYHNGAVWPYVGGAHARAAAVAGRRKEAASLLRGVAEANALDDWSFPEWIHRDTAEPSGARRQVWNAGAYVWAYAAGG
jgi:hypothetical protein